jgi:hypothetical protein
VATLGFLFAQVLTVDEIRRAEAHGAAQLQSRQCWRSRSAVGVLSFSGPYVLCQAFRLT